MKAASSRFRFSAASTLVLAPATAAAHHWRPSVTTPARWRRWCAITVSLMVAGCLTPPHLRQVEQEAKDTLSRIAPIVCELLAIPPTRIPDFVVVPRGGLNDDTGGAFDHERIYVAARSKVPVVEIVARELAGFLIHSRYPSLPYLIEQGVAQAIGAELSGTLDERLLQAIFTVRGHQPMSCTFDMEAWQVRAKITAEGDLSVPWSSDQATLETQPHEERKLMQARAFLTVRALMDDDRTSADDLIPSLVRHLTPNLLETLGDPCTRPCGTYASTKEVAFP